MEDGFQIIIYIVLGIIYFVFSILGESKNKKKPQAKKVPKASTQISPNNSREASLQKILREIQAERNMQGKQTTYDENRSEDFFQDNYAEKFERGEIFDRSKHPNFEKIKIKSQLSEEKRTTTPRRVNPYQKLLKQKDAAKQAFIVSEIFSRKF